MRSSLKLDWINWIIKKIISKTTLRTLIFFNIFLSVYFINNLFSNKWYSSVNDFVINYSKYRQNVQKHNQNVFINCFYLFTYNLYTELTISLFTNDVN